MRPWIATALLAGWFTATLPAQEISALPPPVPEVLRSIRAADTGRLAVSEEDGRFLRVLVATRGATSVLEIGAANGYSGIWLGLGARETGGRVVAIEYDPGRATEAAANIRRAGLTDVVRIVQGDAFAEIPRLAGMFDFVFLDAWKPDYKKFFDLVYPRLAPGGVFVAHNVVNKKNEMEPFLRTILTHPALFTTIVSPSHEGMSISYKTR
ncbi:MAG: O-methyltransferase [Acidobacteria bacterium]|nr:O-methyltransferase [Acidobacteriota bacterium]